MLQLSTWPKLFNKWSSLPIKVLIGSGRKTGPNRYNSLVTVNRIFNRLS